MKYLIFYLYCVIFVRRSQWSGAKALAKLIKPRKESSRERGGDRDKEGGKERERTKSAPDIPLPAPPAPIPPENLSPRAQRMGNDLQDGSHAHSNHGNHTASPTLGPQSPAVTPISRGKHTTCNWQTHPKSKRLSQNITRRCA